ncbi:MAG: NAD-dependent epimerase/dehydratase family protein [Chloroflexi bacterium]|nr:NAD-dependent epimerase/dehydratase family protein [Chloroflexota bacterium]
MRVLVTGATGLIGRHTLALLQAHGHAVRTFQRSPAPGVEYVAGDVRSDRAALCHAADGCAALVHLAGRGDVEESRHDPAGYAELNAGGALHALEAARAAGAVFVLASSQRVYPLKPGTCREADPPAPDSPYGYAKWVAEVWCRMASEQFDVPTRVLRFFSVYGPGQQANGGSGVVSIFVRAALDGRPLVVQSAGRRDFTDARDVARGILIAVEHAQREGGHHVFNIATGAGTTFGELADSIVRLADSTSPVELRLREAEGNDLVADTSHAREVLGFSTCVRLADGLERYIQWTRQNCS